MIDAADSYGTHGIVAEAMKHMNREEITLISKIWVKEGGIPDAERPDADIVIDRFPQRVKHRLYRPCANSPDDRRRLDRPVEKANGHYGKFEIQRDNQSTRRFGSLNGSHENSPRKPVG
jgi:hypothetical protein